MVDRQEQVDEQVAVIYTTEAGARTTRSTARKPRTESRERARRKLNGYTRLHMPDRFRLSNLEVPVVVPRSP